MSLISIRRHRRSLRLRGYDYAREGAYFITLCAQARLCVFGDVVDGEMRLNDAGQMTERWWLNLSRKFPTVDLDQYVVMPNHFHGIVVLATTDPGAQEGPPLPTIVQWFKTMTTNEYIRGVKTLGWEPFFGKLWQRNYYEHVIRDEESLDGIRRYIADNPAQWAVDRENPIAAAPALSNESWRV